MFDYRLRDRPVVVLSNNDGCCVARSEESKALGIRMGQPFFEVRDLLAENRGVALSSNYTLYADMSRRLMTIIGQFSPEQEIYSIDESFRRFAGFGHWDLTQQGRELRARVLKWIGLPVGVGIGATKTLAKLANRLAKKHADFRAEGVCNLLEVSAERVLPVSLREFQRPVRYGVSPAYWVKPRPRADADGDGQPGKNGWSG